MFSYIHSFHFLLSKLFFFFCILEIQLNISVLFSLIFFQKNQSFSLQIVAFGLSLKIFFKHFFQKKKILKKGLWISTYIDTLFSPSKILHLSVLVFLPSFCILLPVISALLFPIDYLSYHLYISSLFYYTIFFL